MVLGMENTNSQKFCVRVGNIPFMHCLFTLVIRAQYNASTINLIEHVSSHFNRRSKNLFIRIICVHKENEQMGTQMSIMIFMLLPLCGSSLSSSLRISFSLSCSVALVISLIFFYVIFLVRSPFCVQLKYCLLNSCRWSLIPPMSIVSNHSQLNELFFYAITLSEHKLFHFLFLALIYRKRFPTHSIDTNVSISSVIFIEVPNDNTINSRN